MLRVFQYFDASERVADIDLERCMRVCVCVFVSRVCGKKIYEFLNIKMQSKLNIAIIKTNCIRSMCIVQTSEREKKKENYVCIVYVLFLLAKT